MYALAEPESFVPESARTACPHVLFTDRNEGFEAKQLSPPHQVRFHWHWHWQIDSDPGSEKSLRLVGVTVTEGRKRPVVKAGLYTAPYPGQFFF
jgi:hypothetical protein